MADERKMASRHTVTMDRRENVVVTGVIDVISFDEEMIVADTEMGVLVLRGENLHVNRLNLDVGELEIDGDVDNLSYEEAGGFSKGKGSLLTKIFK